MEQKWQRTEDKSLFTHFAGIAQKLMAQQTELRKGQGLMSSKKKAEVELNEVMFQQAQASLDFRAYRIPAHYRHLIISRYYMTQLRSRSRTWSQFHDNLSAAVRTNRDIRGFIQASEIKLSHTASSETDEQLREDAKKSEEAAPPPFWSISDETALDLINIAGRLLVNVKPFQEHPGNKVPEGSTRSTRPHTVEAPDEDKPPSQQQIEIAVDRIAKKQLSAEYGGGQKDKHSKRNEPLDFFTEDVDEVEPSLDIADLEGVFGGFTPRLDEEAQRNEERRCRPSVASTAASDRGLLDADKGLESLRSIT